MTKGAPDYTMLGEVKSEQVGEWNVGQAGVWAMAATQAGSWIFLDQPYEGETGVQIRQKLITCIAETPEETPTSTEIVLVDGNVRRIAIVIPRGHAGLTGIRIEQEAQMLLPGEGTEWIVGDGQVIDVPLDYDMIEEEAVFKIVVKTYNTDDTYPHAWAVRIWIKPTF